MALTDMFNNAPRPQKTAAGIVGVLIVAALGYFAVSPKLAERDALRQRSAALHTELVAARATEANLRPFRRQVDELRQRLDVANSRLPSDREIPSLYRQLSDLAFQSGLAVSLFAPKPPEDRDVVTEIPISVSAEGTYHQLGAFFARMGRIARIVTLRDFRVAGTGAERPAGTVRAELTLATYLLRAEGAPPTTTAKAAPAAPQPAAVPPVSGARGASR